MSIVSPIGPYAPLRHELDALRGKWLWFLLLGIALVVLGTLALGLPWVMTLTSVTFLGVLLLTGGAVEAVGAFWARTWSGFFLSLLSGVLYLALGFLCVAKPIKASAALTLVIAMFLLVGGLFKIIASLTYRFPSWGWVLLSGIVGVALGIMIWQEWPGSSVWVIGLFVGIEMIFTGWTWVMLALELRRLPTMHMARPNSM